MNELKNIQEKIQGGVDHFTTSEVTYLLNQIVHLGGIIQSLRNNEKVPETEIGKLLKTQKHLTLIQGGLK